MSNIGVHSFQIPHDHVAPTRDMIAIRIPMPPRKIGSILTSDLTRDLAQHNVMAGRITAMGPLAFSYKDVNEAGETVMRKQTAKIGDWVLIRPYAGTLVQGGQIQVTSGWRYISSFQDVIGVVPADKMPDPATLEWDLDESQQHVEGAAVDVGAEAKKASELPADVGVRERTVYAKL